MSVPGVARSRAAGAPESPAFREAGEAEAEDLAVAPRRRQPPRRRPRFLESGDTLCAWCVLPFRRRLPVGRASRQLPGLEIRLATRTQSDRCSFRAISSRFHATEETGMLKRSAIVCAFALLSAAGLAE